MKAIIDFTTNLPLQVGSPIITIYPEDISEFGSQITIEYIDGNTNELLATKNVLADRQPIPAPLHRYPTRNPWRMDPQFSNGHHQRAAPSTTANALGKTRLAIRASDHPT